MKETDEREIAKQAVLAEINEWKLHPDENSTWHSKLNNFHANLPSDYYSNTGGRQRTRIVYNLSFMDQVSAETHDKNNPHGNSELYRSQTPREFFNTIDQAVTNNPNVLIDEINRLQRLNYEIPNIRMSQNMSPEDEQRENDKIDKAMEAIRALYEYALPIYVDLRVMGYSHFDLTG